MLSYSLKSIERCEVKFHLFFFTIFVFSNTFAADWQKVDEFDNKSIYVDIASVKEHNGYVYYSELIDFKEAIFGALSRIKKFKAKCATMEQANLSIRSYTGQMGKYIVINEAKNDGTRFIKDSKSSTLKFACSRTM